VSEESASTLDQETSSADPAANTAAPQASEPPGKKLYGAALKNREVAERRRLDSAAAQSQSVQETAGESAQLLVEDSQANSIQSSSRKESAARKSAASTKTPAATQRTEAAADTPSQPLSLLSIERTLGAQAATTLPAAQSLETSSASADLLSSPLDKTSIAPAAAELASANAGDDPKEDPLMSLLRRRLKALVVERDELWEMLREERRSQQVEIARLNGMIEKLFSQSQNDRNALRVEYDISVGRAE